ncbi:MAG: restriction endonuclease subunit S [Minisyncoccota bacterium]
MINIMKTNTKPKLHISLSKEHSKYQPDVADAFKGLDVSFDGGLMRFSTEEMVMQVILAIGTGVVSSAVWDLIKVGIKNIHKKFNPARVTLRDSDSVMYTVKPDLSVTVLVVPDRAKEFEHIKTFDDLISYLKKEYVNVNSAGWKETKLTDIGVFSKGSGITKDQLTKTGHNAIRYGELYTKFDFKIEKIYSHIPTDILSTTTKIKYGDILLAGSGETNEEIGKSASYLLHEDCYAGGDVIIFSPKNANSLFLSYFLNIGEGRKKLTELGQGQSVVHIYKSEIEKLKLHLPSLPEQNRIVSVLETWDKSIENLTRKIETKKQVKKYLMWDLLMGKKRLSGFKDKWQTFEVGELLDYEQPSNYIVSDTNYSNEYKTPVLTANKGFVLGYTNETEGIYKNTPVIIFDDFTMDNKFVDFEFKVKSSAIKILTPKNKDVNLRFIFERLQLINIVIGEHRRHYLSEYQYITIDIPNVKEQNAIENILTTADKEITELEKKLLIIKEQKRYLLNNLITGTIRTPETLSTKLAK